jgi:2-hydroxychromene-2-carboxylate isomerase
MNSTDTFTNLFSNKFNDQKIKDELIKKTSDSFNKGIFGVPTFIVNEKMFWGQDRLDFALNEAKK